MKWEGSRLKSSFMGTSWQGLATDSGLAQTHHDPSWRGWGLQTLRLFVPLCDLRVAALEPIPLDLDFRLENDPTPLRRFTGYL